VIKALKSMADESNGQLSVLLSIHQPNNEILSYFDNVGLM
jgi:ABC-type multidrug transport system ATPase subunit